MKKGENQAYATTVGVRGSVQKFGLVADMIRGERAGQAVSLLNFSRRRSADVLKKTLLSAIANAENNHSLDIDRLRVVRVDLGKSFVMKRMRARARGRSARILKPLSRVTVVVEEEMV
jgi:large subunit ribosomal protein L22